MLNVDPYASSESSSDSEDSSSYSSSYCSSGSDSTSSDSDDNDCTENSKKKTGYTDQPKNATALPPSKLAVSKNLYSNLPCSKMQEPDAVQTLQRAAKNSSKVKYPNNDNCNDVAIKKAKLDTETPKASTSCISNVLQNQINSKSERPVLKLAEIINVISESDDEVVEVPLKRSIRQKSRLTISQRIRRLSLLAKKPALKSPARNSPEITVISDDDEEEKKVVAVPLPLNYSMGGKSCSDFCLFCRPPTSSRFTINQWAGRPHPFVLPEVNLFRITLVPLAFYRYITAKRTIILPGRSFLESIEDFKPPEKVEASNDDLDDDVVEVPILSEDEIMEKAWAARIPSPYAYGQPNVKRTIIIPGRSFLECIPDIEWPRIVKAKDNNDDSQSKLEKQEKSLATQTSPSPVSNEHPTVKSTPIIPGLSFLEGNDAL